MEIQKLLVYGNISLSNLGHEGTKNSSLRQHGFFKMLTNSAYKNEKKGKRHMKIQCIIVRFLIRGRS